MQALAQFSMLHTAIRFIRRNIWFTLKSCIKAKKDKEDKGRWSYWNIYTTYGLQGAHWKLFIVNPLCILMVLCELVIGIVNTFCMKNLTTGLTKGLTKGLTTGLTTDPTNSPVTDINDKTTYMQVDSLIMYLFVILFVYNMNDLVKYLLRNKNDKYKHAIIERIFNAIVTPYRTAPMEIYKKYSADEYYEAISRFLWVYDNTTDSMVSIMVQIVRSLILCSYVLWADFHLLPIIVISYLVIWKYLVPYLSRKKEKDDSTDKWSTSYYSTVEERNIFYNPSYEKVYPTKPDHVSDFMKINTYYNARNYGWQDTQSIMNLSQNIIVFLIVIGLVYSSNYATAIVVLINRSSLFEIINAYSRMLEIEKNADRSMEKIKKILNEIDAENDRIEKENISLFKPHTNGSKKHIKSIDFNNLLIMLDPEELKKESEKGSEKVTDNKNEIAIEMEATSTSQEPVSISMPKSHIDIIPHKVLLVEGETGCGKTTVIETLAGLHSRNRFGNMSISYTDGTYDLSEFNGIIDKRAYIGQALTEDYIFNGSIRLTLQELYPGGTYSEIREFLQNGFLMKDSIIPATLSDKPHAKLSGGERQRFIMSSQIWKIIITKPDFIIIDEGDRALDKKTATSMIEWIIDNTECFIIMVSHLTEVKQMLEKKKCISKVWTFDGSNPLAIKIIEHAN